MWLFDAGLAVLIVVVGDIQVCIYCAIVVIIITLTLGSTVQRRCSSPPLCNHPGAYVAVPPWFAPSASHQSQHLRLSIWQIHSQSVTLPNANDVTQAPF